MTMPKTLVADASRKYAADFEETSGQEDDDELDLLVRVADELMRWESAPNGDEGAAAEDCNRLGALKASRNGVRRVDLIVGWGCECIHRLQTNGLSCWKSLLAFNAKRMRNGDIVDGRDIFAIAVAVERAGVQCLKVVCIMHIISPDTGSFKGLRF